MPHVQNILSAHAATRCSCTQWRIGNDHKSNYSITSNYRSVAPATIFVTNIACTQISAVHVESYTELRPLKTSRLHSATAKSDLAALLPFPSHGQRLRDTSTAPNHNSILSAKLACRVVRADRNRVCTPTTRSRSTPCSRRQSIRSRRAPKWKGAPPAGSAVMYLTAPISVAPSRRYMLDSYRAP